MDIFLQICRLITGVCSSKYLKSSSGHHWNILYIILGPCTSTSIMGYTTIFREIQEGCGCKLFSLLNKHAFSGKVCAFCIRKTLLVFSACRTRRHTPTYYRLAQVEKYHPDATGKYQNSKKHRSSISVNKPGNGMYLALNGTGRNLKKLAVEYGHWIPSSNF